MIGLRLTWFLVAGGVLLGAYVAAFASLSLGIAFMIGAVLFGLGRRYWTVFSSSSELLFYTWYLCITPFHNFSTDPPPVDGQPLIQLSPEAIDWFFALSLVIGVTGLLIQFMEKPPEGKPKRWVGLIFHGLITLGTIALLVASHN